MIKKLSIFVYICPYVTAFTTKSVLLILIQIHFYVLQADNSLGPFWSHMLFLDPRR